MKNTGTKNGIKSSFPESATNLYTNLVVVFVWMKAVTNLNYQRQKNRFSSHVHVTFLATV